MSHHIITHIRRQLILLLIMVPMAVTAQVQHISGSVAKTMKTLSGSIQRMPVSVPIYIFDHAQEAQSQANKYRKESLRQGQYATITSNDVVTPDYDGHFETDISAKGALLIINEGVVKVVRVSEKTLTYDIVFESEAADGILLQNADIYGERRGLKIKELPAIDDGPTIRWNVNIALPEGYTEKNHRLIFQPIAVDCQTEDTIQYLEPMVFEGKSYHRAQSRLQGFDYQQNDPLAPYYQKDIVLNGRPLTFNWQCIWQKPDAERSYKWKSVIRVEDYTHVFYDDDSREGSCNSRKPWKMLDVAFARKEMPLTEEFYEQSRAQLSEVPRDLALTFNIGTAQLSDDPQNQSMIEHLVRELQSYGRQLIDVKIQGTASPDGSVQTNIELAQKRADKALSMIRPYLGKAGCQTIKPKVYTWYDVADSLSQRGKTLEADEMRQYAKENKTMALRQMIESDPDIGDILQHLRLMKCSYTIRQNRVLEPEEALWTYYNDKSYAEGADNKFSNGDYYHMFRQISDPAELRRLTERVYNEQKDRTTSKYSPFAAYVANRMACYRLEEDSIDLSILEPFVDMKSGLETMRQISFDNEYKYMTNRRQIVANQAAMYFKALNLGASFHLANKLPSTNEYQDIKMFTDLETLFFKPNKTADETRRATQALAYAMRQGLGNKVVLSYELAPELGLTYQQVEQLADSLSDDDAKKWYIKSMIAANTEPAEEDFMELASRYGADEALRMTENRIPIFLAYLQHCLDIDPGFYAKQFVTDVHVSDDLRKKYPYKPEEADKYRQKFVELSNQQQKKTQP